MKSREYQQGVDSWPGPYEQVEQADDEHQARVLEERDEGVHDSRNHQLECLGHDDQCGQAPEAQAQEM